MHDVEMKCGKCDTIEVHFEERDGGRNRSTLGLYYIQTCGLVHYSKVPKVFTKVSKDIFSLRHADSHRPFWLADKTAEPLEL